MSGHHDFSVIDPQHRRGYSREEQTLEFLRDQLRLARDEIDVLSIPGLTLRHRVASSAKLYRALNHLDRYIPEVEGWVCGYYWRNGQSWSGFSAHTTKEHAESWLPYWRAEVPNRDGWQVVKTVCEIGKFVEGGPPPIPTPEEAR
jgi:hypothetical protein